METEEGCLTLLSFLLKKETLFDSSSSNALLSFISFFYSLFLSHFSQNSRGRRREGQGGGEGQPPAPGGDEAKVKGTKKQRHERKNKEKRCGVW